MRSWPIWLGSLVLFSTLLFTLDGGPDMIRLHQHSESTTGDIVAIEFL
jgi:hypothetical protein